MDNDELKSVTLQIWDTAGQERFQSLGRAFYRGAEACVLVYDITNSTSFDNLEIWRQEFLLKAMPKDPDVVPFFVLGNKVDKENEREVPQEKVEQWLKKNPDIIYYEVSALEGSNVNQAFSKIAQNFLQIQTSMRTEPIEPAGPKKKFDLENQKRKNKKKCC